MDRSTTAKASLANNSSSTMIMMMINSCSEIVCAVKIHTVREIRRRTIFDVKSFFYNAVSVCVCI